METIYEICFAHDAVKFLAVWMGQALWVWVTLLPVLILNGSRPDNNFQWSDAVGAVLWAVGFSCEALADYQKSAFKAKPENKGRFINTGGPFESIYPMQSHECTMSVLMAGHLHHYLPSPFADAAAHES